MLFALFQAEIIDVQYGTIDDLLRLQSSTNVTKKIALIKLGQAPLLYKVGLSKAILDVFDEHFPNILMVWFYSSCKMTINFIKLFSRLKVLCICTCCLSNERKCNHKGTLLVSIVGRFQVTYNGMGPSIFLHVYEVLHRRGSLPSGRP